MNKMFFTCANILFINGIIAILAYMYLRNIVFLIRSIMTSI